MSTAGSEQRGQLHGGDEVEEGWFDSWAHTQSCSMVEKVMSTAGSERRGQLHGRIEEGRNASREVVTGFTR